jgi:hypothetical protein
MQRFVEKLLVMSGWLSYGLLDVGFDFCIVTVWCVCYIINYNKTLFIHESFIYFTFKMVGDIKFSGTDFKFSTFKFTRITNFF